MKTYTFKTRIGLINHLRALVELSASIEHSSYPISDFEFELPSIMSNCLLIKKLSKNTVCPNNNCRIYIAFRTCGFEFATSASHFAKRISAFSSTIIAAYFISFVDGYYILGPIIL